MTSHPVARCRTYVKVLHAVKTNYGMQVGALKHERGCNYTEIPNLSAHGDKEETWRLTTVRRVRIG